MSLIQSCPSLSLVLLILSVPSLGEFEINQSPYKIIVQEGGSVQITCSFTIQGEPVGVYLQRRLTEKVTYIQNNGDKFFDRNHTEVFGNVRNFTVTLHWLQKNESDLYMCDGTIRIPSSTPKSLIPIRGSGTLVIITDGIYNGSFSRNLLEDSQTKCSRNDSSAWMIYVFIVLVVIILILIGVFIFLAKTTQTAFKHCYKPKKKANQNIVYEDMSYSLRRNTGSNPTYYLAS
uniref:T-cell antigen CD7-like isoform X2 n=1 Tax=Geotrypetes seraphini TaxID=260995 RepID=A0A6P8SI24_GEOSA|nr:T-cell antigen CD7-like isoform X2 [Geotrypetes seraphini]